MPPRLIAEFRLPGEPVSKERPRLGAGGRTYTPAKTRRAEEHIAWAYRAATNAPMDRDSAFAVFAEFHTKRATKDGDNMLKTLLDGLNMTAYKDDSQVVEFAVRKRITDSPMTVCRVYTLGPLADYHRGGRKE